MPVKAGRALAGRRGDLCGDVDFDGAVVELRAFEQDHAGAVFAGARETDGFAVEVFGGLGVETLLNEVVGVGEGEGLGGRCVRRADRSGVKADRRQQHKDGGHAEVEALASAGHARDDMTGLSAGARMR